MQICRVYLQLFHHWQSILHSDWPVLQRMYLLSHPSPEIKFKFNDLITCGIDYARWSDLLQYNPLVFRNEVACWVAFYWLAKIFLHQKPAHITIHADHHHIFLCKSLLFFELLDLIEVFIEVFPVASSKRSLLPIIHSPLFIDYDW